MRQNQRGGFWAFYRGAYHADHQAWPNRLLHVFGTLSGIMLLCASFTIMPIWSALAFPMVHALPGLLGHRVFERNSEIGDVRFIGGHYPNIWFMAANHVMTFELLTLPILWLLNRIIGVKR